VWDEVVTLFDNSDYRGREQREGEKDAGISPNFCPFLYYVGIYAISGLSQQRSCAVTVS